MYKVFGFRPKFRGLNGVVEKVVTVVVDAFGLPGGGSTTFVVSVHVVPPKVDPKLIPPPPKALTPPLLT